jgi:hypothetical protein
MEPAGEGYEHPYVVTVRYKCGCLESQSVKDEPKWVRDFAGRNVPKTTPPTKQYPGEG